MLYKRFDTSEDEAVQFVGVYAPNWQPEWGQPAVMFREATEQDILDVLAVEEEPDKTSDIIDRLNGVNYVDAIDDAINELERLRYLVHNLRAICKTIYAPSSNESRKENMSAVLERCEKAEKGSDIYRLMSYIHGMSSAAKYLRDHIAELEHKNVGRMAT